MFNTSGHSFADVSDLTGYTADLTDQSVVQRDGSSQSAGLHALLRATKVKESSILEAIQRLGGGRKGLCGVLKAVLLWLEAKTRSNAESSEKCASNPDTLQPGMEEFDHISRSNLDCGGVGNGSSLNNPSHSDLNYVLNLARNNDGNFSDTKRSIQGGEKRSELLKHESQCTVFMGEPGSVAGLSDGPRLQGSSPTPEDTSSVDWVSPMSECINKHEKLHHTGMIVNLSPSPDRSSVQCAKDLIAHCDTLTQQSNMWGHSLSHVGYRSSESSDSFSAQLNTATVFGVPDSFDAVRENAFTSGRLYDANPSSPSPIDLHPLDFNFFLKQGSMLFGENLCLSTSPHGCGPIDRVGSLGYPLSPQSSVDAEHSVSRLEVVAQSKASLAGLSRLARKERKCFRKASLLANAHAFAGESGRLHSSGSLRSTCRSHGGSKPGQRAYRTTDLEDHRFLLMKVLRASDLGKLGRIVLSKNDAESCLPRLDAKEGIPFPCQDYDTGEIMMLRYRFWANNRSRMYILEHTGDFSRRHFLREYDKMLLYRNKESGSYVMRACKFQYSSDDLQKEQTEGHWEYKEWENSLVGPSSGATSFLSETETVVSEFEAASVSSVPVSAVVNSRNPDFADLPAAPITQNL